MSRFELALRPKAARARNAYLRAAASAYEQNNTVPAWLRTAHERRIAEYLNEHYTAVIPLFGAMALKQIPGIKSRRFEKKTTFPDLMATWVNREALRKAKLISATDAEDVRDAIQDGLEEGLGTEEIGSRIRKVSSLTASRAATIARTETHAAATFGSVESVREAEQELGVRMNKVWLATNDDRTREDHLAADGQTVGLDERFVVGGELMDRPGDPSASAEQVIGCRCAIAYEEVE